jgi:hypothetical protein
MLLKLESEKERDLVVCGSKQRPKRKYDGLRARVEGKGTKDERIVDRIVGYISTLQRAELTPGSCPVWRAEAF